MGEGGHDEKVAGESEHRRRYREDGDQAHVEKSALTMMIQMLPKLHVSMAPRCDMKIPLHLIPMHAPKDPTAIRLLPARHLWRLRILLPLPRRPQIIMHILLPIFLPEPRIPTQIRLLLALLLRCPQRMPPLVPIPLRPRRRVLLQACPGEDAVPARVLHVHVHVLAAHLDDDVEVDLQVMADAGLDAELVSRGAFPPAAELGGGEVEGGEGEEDGPFAAGGGLLGVGRFGLGEGIERLDEGFGVVGGAAEVLVQVALVVVAVHDGG